MFKCGFLYLKTHIKQPENKQESDVCMNREMPIHHLKHKKEDSI